MSCVLGVTSCASGVPSCMLDVPSCVLNVTSCVLGVMPCVLAVMSCESGVPDVPSCVLDITSCVFGNAPCALGVPFIRLFSFVGQFLLSGPRSAALWNVLSVKSPNSRAQTPETSPLACLSAWLFSERWKRSRVGLHFLTGRTCLCLVNDLSPMKRTTICRASPPSPHLSTPPPPRSPPAPSHPVPFFSARLYGETNWEKLLCGRNPEFHL